MSNKKPVIQIHPFSLQIINEFDSIISASRFTNIHFHDIFDCAKFKYNIAGGYYWRYKTDYSSLDNQYIKCNNFGFLKLYGIPIYNNTIIGMFIYEDDSIKKCISFLEKIHNGEIVKEMWVDIKGYEDLYKISNFGRIISFINYPFIKLMSNTPDKDGYSLVSLHNKFGECKVYRVNRLVGINFIKCEYDINNMVVNHLDESKDNNFIYNLNWLTIKENVNYGTSILRASLKNSIPINQYDKNGNFIKKHDSLTKASISTGAKVSNISKCLHGVRNYTCNSIWKFCDI